MKSLIRVSFAALAVGLASPALSNEFGNIFGSEEVEKASRSASAEALSALQGIFEGLRLRELSEENGAEAFKAAAQRLRQAADQMRMVLKIYMVTELDQRLTEQDLQTLNALYGGTMADAQTVGQLYERFANEAEALAEQIEALSASERPIFPQISGRLSLYIALAGTITEISSRPRN